jgi:hypothetical protein
MTWPFLLAHGKPKGRLPMTGRSGQKRDGKAPTRRQLRAQIIRNGECVFEHEWDSGGPGAGAGVEAVYEWRGQYAVRSADYGPAGPFATLEEALEARGLLHVTDATVEIVCSRFTAQELADLLTEGGEGLPVRVNGEWFAYSPESGKFEWRPDGG